jgi:hypothetical protein
VWLELSLMAKGSSALSVRAMDANVDGATQGPHRKASCSKSPSLKGVADVGLVLVRASAATAPNR